MILKWLDRKSQYIIYFVCHMYKNTFLYACLYMMRHNSSLLTHDTYLKEV